MKSSEKIVVISGGTKGIGRALVDKFASEGFNIGTYSRNLEDLEELRSEIESSYNVHCLIKKTDGSKRTEVEHFAQFIADNDYKIEVLINNTGSFLPGTVLDEDEGTFERMMETNLNSAYYLTRTLGKEMRANGSGHIFNICSTASITAYTNGGSYCIAKHALLGFSKVLREELKEHGVRVTSMIPGATLTASWEGVDLPDERFMKAEDVADTVYSVFSLSKNTVIEEVILRPQLGDL